MNTKKDQMCFMCGHRWIGEQDSHCGGCGQRRDLTPIQQQIKLIKDVALSLNCFVYRYQTNLSGRPGDVRITYALHSQPERPVASRFCDGPMVEIYNERQKNEENESFVALAKFLEELRSDWVASPGGAKRIAA